LQTFAFHTFRGLQNAHLQGFANLRVSHLQGFVHILLRKICRPAASCTVALDISLRNHSQDGFVLRSGPFGFEPLKLTQKIKTDRPTYPFLFGTPSGVRTLDTLIKSDALFQGV